jgi:hypothetical protein
LVGMAAVASSSNFFLISSSAFKLANEPKEVESWLWTASSISSSTSYPVTLRHSVLQFKSFLI